MSYPGQATRHYCPIGTCDWALDEPELPVLTMQGDGGIPGLVKEHYMRMEAVLRAHVEAHDLAEWVTEVVRLRTQVPAPVPDLTAVPWRQGRRKGRNLYAVTGDDWESHPEIGCLDSPELAREAVEAHNAALALSWLLGAGLDVQVTSCGGAGRCCGDIAGRFAVRAAVPDPVAALPLPGGVESHGHASPGEALAFARDWCEQNGITP